MAQAAARRAVRAQNILQLAQTITAGQSSAEDWREAQQRLFEQIEA